MRKSIITVISLVALFMSASCERVSLQDDIIPEVRLVPVTVEAYVPATKVSLDGVTPLWTKGDKISMYTSDQALCPAAFVAQSGGAANTSFSGQKPEGSHLAYAFYPYDSQATYSKKGIKAMLPFKQDGTAANAMMVGYGNEDDGFKFLNVCSLVKFNIPSTLNVTQVEVVRENLTSGLCYLKTDGSSVSVENSTPLSYQDKRAAAVNTNGLSGLQYIAVLPSADKAIALALTNKSGKVAFVNKNFSTGKPFSSGSIKNIGNISSSLTFYDAALVAGPTSNQI